MNRTIHTGVAIAIIAAVAIIFGVVFLWMMQAPQLATSSLTQKNNQPSVPQIPVSVNQPTNALVQNANQTQTIDSAGVQGWKTYQNNTYGFELKYPAKWPIMDIKPGECGEGNICNIIFGIDKPLSVTGEGSGIDATNIVYLYVYSPEALKANNGKDATTGCKKITNVTLSSGLPAEKKQCISAMDGSTEFLYTIAKNGWKYQLVGSEGEKATKVFDTMANSFKFTK
jgi:hypothetical protein